MKRSLLLGAVSALAMIGSAQAADMGGMKETEMAPPLWNWAGFYVGVNGGWIWNEGGLSDNVSETLICNECTPGPYTGYHQESLSGGFGGGQIGFNWQRDRLVFGIETDFQGSSLSNNSNTYPNDGGDPYFSYAHANVDLDWFGSFRGRLGLVPWGNILVYITGGIAYGDVSESLQHSFYSTSGLSPLSGSHSDTYAGYDLGAGVEWGITPAWSVKVEYQFMDLGSIRLQEYAHGSCGDCAWEVASQAQTDLSFNTVRVGINYHFLPEYVPLK